jgi:hypothetical protein
MGEACVRVEETENTHKNLVGKSEGKRLLGRPKSRWEDNIKIAQVVLIRFNWLSVGSNGGTL